MNTLPLATALVNPAAVENPRDSWPAWTDEDRWETTPGDAPDFIPSAEDLAAASELLNADVTDYWTDSIPDLTEAFTVPDRVYREGEVVKSLDCFLDFYPR
jgi:hypothetical protein